MSAMRNVFHANDRVNPEALTTAGKHNIEEQQRIIAQIGLAIYLLDCAAVSCSSMINSNMARSTNIPII